jgi:hypothetical protein
MEAGPASLFSSLPPLVMLEGRWEKQGGVIIKKFQGGPTGTATASGGGGAGGGGGEGGGQRLAEEMEDDNAPLTFDEKRDLCVSMNKLSSLLPQGDGGPDIRASEPLLHRLLLYRLVPCHSGNY